MACRWLKDIVLEGWLTFSDLCRRLQRNRPARLPFLLLIFLMLSVLSGILTLTVCTGFASTDPSTGWLDPETRRKLQIFNVFFAALMIGLLVLSFFLRRRLKEKVANLKKTQQELLEQSELLRLAAEVTSAGIWESRPALSKIHLSRQWWTMLGYPPLDRDLFLQEFRKFIHPADQEYIDRFFESYIIGSDQAPFELESRLLKADGTWCWVLSKGKVLEWDEKGCPTRIIGLDVSIQRIKEAQEKIYQSEAKYHAIIENAPYSIVITSLNGRYLEANKKFLESRGIKEEQLHEIKSRDYVLLSKEEIAEISDTLIKTGSVQNREATYIRPDGAVGYTIFSSVLLDIQGQKQILSMTVDVTERKRAEKALQESEARFRLLFRNAPIPLALLSRDGKLLAFNDSLVRTLGYTTDDVSDMETWWPVAYPDPVYRSKVISGWQAATRQAMETHAPMEPAEYRVTAKNGSVLTMIIGGTVLQDSLIVSFFDITEHKHSEAEREKLQGQLLQSQKLEAVGVLAGGVAHDFNNMLGAIIGYAELALGTTQPDHPLRRHLERILDTAQRSANLTRQLLAFARKQQIDPVVFDLNESVESILKMIRRLIGENIVLSWIPGAGSHIVRMDSTQFDQILVNLCVNARDAIGGVGKITIETSLVVFDDAYGELHEGIAAGTYVLLSVSDDGCGMDAETLSHIFEPFFTTKGLGRGTGMGLATVYGIVRQNGGLINVYSEPHRGTIFKIYIPRYGAEVAEKGKEHLEDIPRSRGETILIVEDDPALLEMGGLMLQRLGYSVIPAGTPFEAIRIVDENPDGMEMFITDVVMPEMNGKDLADRLLKIRPDIKHLFMSGYTSDVIAHQGVLDRGVNFIPKPFSLRDLAVKIRAVLDEPPDMHP